MSRSLIRLLMLGLFLNMLVAAFQSDAKGSPSDIELPPRAAFAAITSTSSTATYSAPIALLSSVTDEEIGVPTPAPFTSVTFVMPPPRSSGR